MKEEWRDVVGYEGLYIVNNFGVIKSLGRKTRNNHQFPPKIIKQRIDKYGYLIVTLYSKDGIRKDQKVHRLVAKAFIDNPDNLPIVNHKNEIKTCNIFSNLEWCTVKYNVNYGTSSLRRSLATKGRPNYKARGSNNYFYGKHFCGANAHNARKVVQYTKNEEFVNKYDCIQEAADANAIHFSGISACCRGVRKTAGGFIWKYA